MWNLITNKMEKQITNFRTKREKKIGLIKPTRLRLKKAILAHFSKTLPNIKLTIKLNRDYKKTFFTKKQQRSSLLKFLNRPVYNICKPEKKCHAKSTLELKEILGKKQESMKKDFNFYKSKPCNHLSSNQRLVNMKNHSSLICNFTSHDTFLKSLIGKQTTNGYSDVSAFKPMPKSNVVNSKSGQLCFKLVFSSK